MENFRVVDNMFVAPDGSFKVSLDAMALVVECLLEHRPAPECPKVMVEGIIFATLTMYDNLDDAEARALVRNPYYVQVVHAIYDAYREEESVNG